MPVQTFFPLTIPGSRRVAERLAIRGVFGLVPVLVYQMAKVGSSAVVSALNRSRVPAFHVHRMDARHLRSMREERARLGWRVPPVPRHDELGLELYERVVSRGMPARVVTMVRDPIARNLSSYFEHLDYIWNTADAHRVVPLDALCDGFHDRYTHREVLTWFDDELLPVLGVDVYTQPFSPAGHMTIAAGEREVLVLKSEAADDAKRNALQTYLGVEIAPVLRTYSTAETAKGEVYRQFLRTIRLTPGYVDQLLNSRYSMHFYGDAERTAMRNRHLKLA